MRKRAITINTIKGLVIGGLIAAALFLIYLASSYLKVATFVYPDTLYVPQTGYVFANRLIVEPNLWNVAYAKGEVSFRVNNLPNIEKLYFTLDLRNIELKEPARIMHGYPELYVGYKPWGNLFTLPLVFPIKVQDAKSIDTTIRFKVTYANTQFGAAYTLWLVDTPTPDGIKPDEWEIMIWLYNEGNIAYFGEVVGTLTVNAYVNGVLTPLEFEVRYLDVGWHYVGFVALQNLHGKEVTLDLRAFLQYLQEALYPTLEGVTSPMQAYILGVEFGTKYGTPARKNARLRWEVDTFKLRVNGDLYTIID